MNKWIVYNDDYAMPLRNKRVRVNKRKKPWVASRVTIYAELLKHKRFKTHAEALCFAITDGASHA